MRRVGPSSGCSQVSDAIAVSQSFSEGGQAGPKVGGSGAAIASTMAHIGGPGGGSGARGAGPLLNPNIRSATREPTSRRAEPPRAAVRVLAPASTQLTQPPGKK